MIDRAAIEAAVYEFIAGVAAPLGLADIRWADQNAGEPQGNFITLRLGDLVPHGQDALVDATDLTRAAGQEIELRVRGERDLTVSVQCWTTATVDAGTAADVLDDVQASLSLPTRRAILTAAGLYPFEVGPVQNLSALEEEGSDFIGRALLEFHCHVATSISEFAGYIATVGLVDADAGTTYDVST